jgi:hypothetical protein
LAATLTGACGEADSRDAPEGEREVAQSTIVPAGTSMTFQVDRTVSTDADAVGDVFTATLREPVVAAGGDALPGGTKSRWTVTESSTQDGQSVLVVSLSSLQVNGDWATVDATVTEATIDADNPDSSGETAAKIGVGAAAGAIVGQIIGRDTRSTLTGAGVGAALGTAVALSTRSGSATLPEGSLLGVRLNSPLQIP